MILDIQAIFSNKQKITTSAASANVIDLGATGTPFGAATPIQRDGGQGTKMPLLVQVVKTFAGATGLTIELQTSVDEAFTAPKKLYSQTLTAAELVEGARCSLPVLPYGSAQRYVRLLYTVAGTATAGAVTAGLTMGNDEWL